MAGEASARYGFPFLEAGQAQKELVHNEALAAIDLALHATVESAGIDVPPDTPVPGQCWIVGPTPEGAWADYVGAIAGWSSNGWRFVAPREGMTAWIADQQLWAVHTGGGWAIGTVNAAAVQVGGVQVVGGRLAAIAAPNGGLLIDGEARSVIVAILDRMRAHGLIEN